MRSHVHREHVIGILRLNGVTVSENVDKNGLKHVIAKGKLLESLYLPEDVPRHLLGRFAHKFDFSMGDFWEPDLLSKIEAAVPPPN